MSSDVPGANVFAESLVCLDAATGVRKWHYQIVHHGLWDYDNPSPPNLVTIRVDASKPTSEFHPVWRFFGADEPNMSYFALNPKTERSMFRVTLWRDATLERI